jgi:NADH dehydrogenase FAD-containing subunit
VVKVDEEAKAGNIQVLMSSNVVRIDPKTVVLRQKDKEFEIPNDTVIVCAGGVLPTPLLKQLGIQIDTKFGTS